MIAIIAIIALLVLIASCISSIENDQPARAISRKRSRLKTDLRDALHLMRRRNHHQQMDRGSRVTKIMTALQWNASTAFTAYTAATAATASTAASTAATASSATATATTSTSTSSATATTSSATATTSSATTATATTATANATQREHRRQLLEENDMRDGLKLIKMPGYYAATLIGYVRNVSGDEYVLLPGWRTVELTSGDRRLEDLAANGPKKDHRLYPPSLVEEEIHRFGPGRVIVANVEAWHEHVKAP